LENNVKEPKSKRLMLRTALPSLGVMKNKNDQWIPVIKEVTELMEVIPTNVLPYERIYFTKNEMPQDLELVEEDYNENENFS